MSALGIVGWVLAAHLLAALAYVLLDAAEGSPGDLAFVLIAMVTWPIWMLVILAIALARRLRILPRPRPRIFP